MSADDNKSMNNCPACAREARGRTFIYFTTLRMRVVNALVILRIGAGLPGPPMTDHLSGKCQKSMCWLDIA